jgi:ABC-type uncharacterized transport system auxiliary subunit
VCAATAVLGGCSLARKVPQLHYYTLSVPPPAAATLAAPVRVGAFTADQPYTTDRIAYRSSPFRLDYYTYHRWAADPRNLLRDTARDYLDAAAGNAPVVPIEIDGHIRRLEEVDAADGWHAALTLDFTVARGGAVLLERTYTESVPADGKRPEAVAAAVSRALARILDRLLADLPAASAGGVTSSPPPAGSDGR